MSLWQKIKHLFTRKHRLPHVDIAFVRWYSRQSCAWSKWRAIENPNILNSDPEVYAKIAGGQRIQIH